MSEEPQVYRVRHKTFKGNYRESTYVESGIEVVGGIATCRRKRAAIELVQTKGYDWLDERDDPNSERFKRNAQKSESLASRAGQAVKDAVKKVTKKKGSKKKEE
jgi:hypothetical protein